MNWIEIKALHRLYETGEVKLNKTISKSPVFKNHETALEIKRNRKTFSRNQDFIEVYENKYLEKYKHYNTFLDSENLLKPQLRFEENDIKFLIPFRRFRALLS